MIMLMNNETNNGAILGGAITGADAQGSAPVGQAGMPVAGQAEAPTGTMGATAGQPGAIMSQGAPAGAPQTGMPQAGMGVPQAGGRHGNTTDGSAAGWGRAGC